MNHNRNVSTIRQYLQINSQLLTRQNMDKIQLWVKWKKMMNKTSYVTSVTMQLCRESLVTCLTCTKTMKKMCALKFDMNKYSSLQNNIQEMAKSQKNNSYICKSCHIQLQQKHGVCVVRDICRNMYVKCDNKIDYDFTNFVVSQCLGHVSILNMKSNIYVHYVTKN